MTKSKSIQDSLRNLNVEKIGNFIIAPISLYASKHCEDKRTAALKEIQNYYNNPSASEQILCAFTELYSNYVNHAEENSYSLIAMCGTKQYVEIACIDTGLGIVNNLSDLYPKQSDKYIINQAIREGVTSKKDSTHLGQGLWMISNLVKNTKGRLEIYSGNGHLSQIGDKIKHIDSPYWKGTIIYCKIFINEGIYISLLPDNDDIKLNVIYN